MKFIRVLFLLSVSTSLFAVSGANTLLEKAAKLKKDQSKLKEINTISKESLNYYTDFKIDNPFAAYIFSLLNNNPSTSQKKFIINLLKNDFKKALNETADLDKSMKSKEKTDFLAMRVYLYWRLGYKQSFFQSWMTSYLSKKDYKHKSFLVLDKYLTPHGGKFVAENNVLFTNEQEKLFLKKKNNQGFAKEIAYTFSLRAGEESLKSLLAMPKGHALEVPMGYSAAFYLAKNERIGDAGKILKNRMESAIQERGDISELSRYYLLIARLLYQARAFEAAQDYYERIPNGDKNYLQAQSELIWIYMYLDKTSTMRGKIATLTSELFVNKFVPESYVVRAISNLKLCYYEDLNKDFTDFVQNNQNWAKKISKGLKTKNYELAFSANSYIRKAEKNIKDLSYEIKEISELSWNTTKNKYWKNQIDSLSFLLKKSQSTVEAEYRQYYTTLSKKLKSAIVKMRFVKIEALDQMGQWKKQQKKLTSAEQWKDSISLKQASTVKGRVVFPYDGVYWPDETFHLKSLAKSHCHNHTKGTK